MKFKPTRKMRVLNWKKLQHNTIKNNKLALWKKESTAANVLTVNGDQIVELFSRVEIVPKAKQEETKVPSVVRQSQYMSVYCHYIIVCRSVCWTIRQA